MKNINIRYFALLREERGTDTEEISVDCHTHAELYEFLKEKYNFSLTGRMIQVAVDDEFCRMCDPVRDNSRIVFIPPVAGG